MRVRVVLFFSGTIADMPAKKFNIEKYPFDINSKKNFNFIFYDNF